MRTAATFRSGQVREQLLSRIISTLADSSIGSMERLAGVPQDPQSRFEFWCAADKRAAKIHGFAFTAGHTFDEAMAECRRLIAANTAWVDLQ